MIGDRMAILDEVAFQVVGEILSVEDSGRNSDIRLRLEDDQTNVTIFAIYDTAMARQSFQLAGDRVVLYGVWADPLPEPDGLTTRMQIIYVERLSALSNRPAGQRPGCVSAVTSGSDRLL